MKKLGIMQPYLFPYIGYFQLIKAVDQHVTYDDIQFIKGGWINRNNLLSSSGRSRFTIRLNSTSPNKLINEIEVVDDFSKFKKTLMMVYQRAPYYPQVSELIGQICGYQDKNLGRFAGNGLRKIAGYLGLKTEFIYSSELKKDTGLKGQAKVIAICKELEADMYINAIGGLKLYNKADFAQADIQLKFLKTGPVEYRQFRTPFVPDLSIIDVLMFNSPEETTKLLDDYELV